MVEGNHNQSVEWVEQQQQQQMVVLEQKPVKQQHQPPQQQRVVEMEQQRVPHSSPSLPNRGCETHPA
jgi:hypothetical protein